MWIPHIWTVRVTDVAKKRAQYLKVGDIISVGRSNQKILLTQVFKERETPYGPLMVFLKGEVLNTTGKHRPEGSGHREWHYNAKLGYAYTVHTNIMEGAS